MANYLINCAPKTDVRFANALVKFISEIYVTEFLVTPVLVTKQSCQNCSDSRYDT